MKKKTGFLFTAEKINNYYYGIMRKFRRDDFSCIAFFREISC